MWGASFGSTDVSATVRSLADHSTGTLSLVADRGRIVTIAAADRARDGGFLAIAGARPASREFRASVRAELVRRAGAGELVVPVARSFPLADALAATELLMGQHPGGKLVLVP